MKKYCQSCNKPTDYADIPAKFCAHCGLPFAGTVASQIKVEPTPVRKVAKKIEEDTSLSARVKRLRQEIREIENNEEIIDDDENTNTSFEVPELELEGGLVFERPTVKFQTVAFDKGNKEKIDRPKSKRVSLKNTIEEFKQEVNGGGRQASKSIGGEGGE
jgi:hypothetical protein